MKCFVCYDSSRPTWVATARMGRLKKGRILSAMVLDLTHEEATMWMAVVLGAFVLGGSIGMLILALLMFAAREG